MAIGPLIYFTFELMEFILGFRFSSGVLGRVFSNSTSNLGFYGFEMVALKIFSLFHAMFAQMTAKMVPVLSVPPAEMGLEGSSPT
jgi:hypothetical protein